MTSMDGSAAKHPCLSCGACCACFRVSFHWSESSPELGGVVPAELTVKLDPHRVAMRGTEGGAQPRCTALTGEIGVDGHCGIYSVRPSVCREVEPAWEFDRPSAQCEKGRLRHGLPPLTPGTWLDYRRAQIPGNDPLGVIDAA
jgi:Fe-S-cluster containining protein